MSVATVHLFASYAELLGATEVAVPILPNATVNDLMQALRELPAGRSLPSDLHVAVNRRFALASDTVEATDEIALIPPVAGG